MIRCRDDFETLKFVQKSLDDTDIIRYLEPYDGSTQQVEHHHYRLSGALAPVPRSGAPDLPVPRSIPESVPMILALALLSLSSLVSTGALTLPISSLPSPAPSIPSNPVGAWPTRSLPAGFTLRSFLAAAAA